MRDIKTRMAPEEAAEYLGCGYDKLLQMVRQRQLPHYRLGRRVFFTKSSLDLWIENQQRQSIKTSG